MSLFCPLDTEPSRGCGIEQTALRRAHFPSAPSPAFQELAHDGSEKALLMILLVSPVRANPPSPSSLCSLYDTNTYQGTVVVQFTAAIAVTRMLRSRP